MGLKTDGTCDRDVARDNREPTAARSAVSRFGELRRGAREKRNQRCQAVSQWQYSSVWRVQLFFRLAHNRCSGRLFGMRRCPTWVMKQQPRKEKGDDDETMRIPVTVSQSVKITEDASEKLPAAMTEPFGAMREVKRTVDSCRCETKGDVENWEEKMTDEFKSE